GDGRGGQGRGAAARHVQGRKGARGRTDRVLPQTSVADQMPEEHRLRSRIAAHADRQTGEAASAGQVLAESGEGVGSCRVGKGAKRRAHHQHPARVGRHAALRPPYEMPKMFSSCPGLSRASTSLQSRFTKRRGWRDKPGHDEANIMTTLPDIPLSATIRSRYVEDINGLRMHVLEAGFETKGRPCVLLLHGFPELAFSWRKVMPVLAAAGYHVIAPDQRGYGRTTGWDPSYDGGLGAFRLPNLVRDAVGLVSAFGHRSVDAVIGHDFGSSVAAWCALIRPDVFRSVVLMSAPFGGPPSLPF